MIPADHIKSIYKRNLGVTERNLEGISNEDSRLDPEPAGNNINWTLGHILASRNHIMPALKQEPFWDEATAAPYMWGTEALAPDKGETLETLLETLAKSQDQIVAGLDALSEEELEEAFGKGTVSKHLAFMAWHEAYHVGQLGLLRRLVGKEGAI